MYSVKDKVPLLNSSALIGEHKSSFMIRIITGGWPSCELSNTCDFYVEQSSMRKVHRKQKRRLTMGMSFHKEGECRSISAKPTGIKKEKDIPRLPES